MRLYSLSLEDLKIFAKNRDIDVDRIKDPNIIINLITYNGLQMIIYEDLDDYIISELLHQRSIKFDESYTRKGKIFRLLDDDENWTSMSKPRRSWDISDNIIDQGHLLVNMGFRFSPFIIPQFVIKDIIITTANRLYFKENHFI